MGTEASLDQDNARRIAELTEEVARLMAELSDRDQYIADLEASHSEQMRVRTETEARAVADALMLRTSLNALYASTSWRLTRPLRALTILMRDLRGRMLKNKRNGGYAGSGSLPGTQSFSPEEVVHFEPDPTALNAWTALLSQRPAKGR